MATHAQPGSVSIPLGRTRSLDLPHWLLGFPLASLPFFLGGARPWFWSTIAAIFFLGVLVLILRDSIREPVPLQNAWTWGLGLAMFYAFFQALPLPPAVVAVLNPERFQWVERAQAASGLSPAAWSLSYASMDTLFQACWWVFLALFAVVLHTTLRQQGSLKWLFAVLYSIAAFEAFYGLLQVLIPSLGVLWESPGSGDARGTFVNRNHYACFLGMVWPLLLANLLAQRPDSVEAAGQKSFLQLDKDRKQRQKQIFLTVMVGLVLLSLFFSHSRGGILGALVALTVFVLFGGRQRGGVLFFVLSCWLVMVGYGSIIGFDQILARFDILQESAPGRFRIWEDTWRMIQDHPWVGTGLGTYSMVIRLYQSHLNDQLHIGHAHNDYLELTAEAGIPAAVLLVGLVWGYWWKTAVHILRTGRTQQDERAVKPGPGGESTDDPARHKVTRVRVRVFEGEEKSERMLEKRVVHRPRVPADLDDMQGAPVEGSRSRGDRGRGLSGREGSQKERQLLRLGALAGSAAFLCHSWVEFNWAIPANQLYFVMLLVLMAKGPAAAKK